jgi:hypothetical protein
VTSVPSREDIRAELYKAGIRSTFILTRLMSAIDAYAYARVRQVRPIEDIPGDGWGYLQPGQSDIEQRVTRCLMCTRAKTWSYFGTDKTSPTGHKITCKSCLRVRKPLTEDQRRWRCISCKSRRAPHEFPKEKQAFPRLRVNCNYCAEKLPGN